MILRSLVVGPFLTNCYVLVCDGTRKALVIDPGANAVEIVNAVNELRAQVEQIVLTHFHADHTGAARSLRASTGAVLAIHEQDAPLLEHPPAFLSVLMPGTPRDLAADRLLCDGDEITVGDLVLEVLHTPGHSPGGISLWLRAEHLVFAGDTLFREGVGRTDLGGDPRVLLQSIRDRLLALPDETMVYPGHGPATTIRHERQQNPWLR